MSAEALAASPPDLMNEAMPVLPTEDSAIHPSDTQEAPSVGLESDSSPESQSGSQEASVARRTAGLVIGMEAVGLAVDASLKVASAYWPALEGLATRELIAGGGDMAVISKVEGGHAAYEAEAVQLSRRQRIARRLGSTALMVGTAYTSARLGIGMAEAAGVHNGWELFGIQVASKAAGLSGMNVLRSRRQQRANAVQ